MINLDSSRGLIVGEAVMMGIAPIVGRNAAHDIVYAACKDCIEDGTSTLYDQLVKREEVSSRISNAELRDLCDPRKYLGAAQQMVDDTIRAGSATLPPKSKVKVSNGVNGHSNGYH